MATLPTLLAPLSSGFGFFGLPGLFSGYERSSDASLTGSRSLYLALVPRTLLATSGWEETRQVAMGLGGDLAVIDSAPEQAFISDSLQALAALAKDDNRSQALRNYWIGLEDQDPGTSLRWAWTNGMEVATPQGETTWGYKNWATGQPDNSFGGQDKGMLWGVNTRSDGSLVPRTGNELFQWDDIGPENVKRGDIFYSLAEIPVREYNGHFYRLVSGDFSESSEKARALGGSLASVDNDAELQYLRTFLKGNESAWIAPSGSATSALLRADGSRENLNSGQIATFGNPRLGLVEITPAGNQQAPTSSIYITDVIWPEAKTYASNDKLTVEVKLSAPLDFTYKGKPLKDALASNDAPYGLPLLQTFGMKLSGESSFYRTVTMAVDTTTNFTWPTNSLKLTLDAKDLAPTGEPSTAIVPPKITLALAALRLELTGKNEDSSDYWDNSQFALAGNVSLDLTLPATHQAGKEGFGVQAGPSTTPPTLQTLPISRNASPAYYLNLGNILGTIDQSQDLSKGELQINSKGLGETLSNLASDRLGSWLNDPVTAVANGHWSSTPVSVPSYANAEINPWPEYTENASIYFVDGGTSGLGNLKADIGIDNMISIWINGEYRYGAYSPVHYDPNNLPLQNIDLGPLKPGLNAIQILRSDEFGWAGADWTIRADSITGAPLDIDEDGALTNVDAGLMMRAILGTYPEASLSQGLVPEAIGADRRAALHQRAYDAITAAAGATGSSTEAPMDLDGDGLVQLHTDALLLQSFLGGSLTRTTPAEQLHPLLGSKHRHGDPGVLIDRMQFGLSHLQDDFRTHGDPL